MKTKIGIACAIGLLVPCVAAAQGLHVPDGAKPAGKSASSVFLVRLSEQPVATYDGSVKGYAATRPARGKKIDSKSNAVKRWAAYLDARHDAVLAAAGGGDKLYDYRYTFNGFAAVLTPAQARALTATPGVLSVQRDTHHMPTTDASPRFLGLSTPGGLWDQLGGVAHAGEDIIIGVVDTGIWPEHPSFSDQIDLADRPGSAGKRTRAYGPPPASWNGTCQSGEQWSQDDCNNKLIGARYFLAGFGHQGIITTDYLSARDSDGHGSHTSATAGGNSGVQAAILGSSLGVVSGMAPRARIAMYKACWNGEGCAGTDLVAAIDTAVADGVDVINYSIGSDASVQLTGDSVSFLFAAAANVFVATSAGNAGPGSATVGSPASSPWVTSVGASTHDRTFEGAVTLGNGARYAGASVTGGTATLSIVDSADVGSELCIPGELDPARVSGKIVLCKRGVIARVDKSRAVFIAGGAGMVLYNAVPNDTVVSDNHYVAAVHVDNAAGLAVKAYIAAAGAGATARITGGTAVSIPGSSMASFSSRGPTASAPDLIKPDVTAPGVNILAANTPTPEAGAPGQLFQTISGTSMSSPHTAGSGALLKQAHPDWTPAMIKSALMTAARQNVTKEDGVTAADPFDMGGGHIVPTAASNPGLVYDAGFRDYVQFLCGDGDLSPSSAICTALGSIDPSDLNLATIGVASLAGVQTVTRTLTNVGAAGTYTASVDAPPGVDVTVSPASLTLASGASAAYSVTFTTQAGAPVDQWTFGALTWSDGSHRVRSAIAVRPVALAAPNEVAGSGASGSTTWDVQFGYAGAFSATAHGLVPATVTAGNVADDPANDVNVALQTGVGVTFHPIAVPAGTVLARISTFDGETDGADDIDLYVFGPGPDFPFAGGSAGGTAEEEVNLESPAPGTYIVVVHGYQTDGADSNYRLFNWNVGAAATSLAASGPTIATLGATGSITATWSGLAPATRWLGSVSYHATAAPAGYDDARIGRTFVRVRTE